MRMPRLLAWLVFRFLQRYAEVPVAVPDLLEPLRRLHARFEAIGRHGTALIILDVAGIVGGSPGIELITGAWDEFGKGQGLGGRSVVMIKSN